MPEIIVTTNCELCDEHKTMLGNLISCVKGVYGTEELERFDTEQKLELIKTLYEQFCLDNRTKFISNQKKETTAQIHKYQQQGR